MAADKLSKEQENQSRVEIGTKSSIFSPKNHNGNDDMTTTKNNLIGDDNDENKDNGKEDDETDETDDTDDNDDDYNEYEEEEEEEEENDGVGQQVRNLMVEFNALMDEPEWEKARDKLQEAIRILEEFRGPEDDDTLDIKCVLACNYRNQGRYREAEQIDREVLVVRQKIYGDKDSETAESLDNLALDLKAMGRVDEALELQEQALDILINVDGEGSQTTQTAMHNLANTYNKCGRFEKAADLHKKTLRLRMDALGKENRLTIITMDLLGCDYQELGQIDRAIELQEEAVSLAAANLGESASTTIKCSLNLALTYGRLHTADGYRKQLTMLEPLLERARQTFGKDNPDMINVMNNLAIAYVNSDRLQDAEPLLIEAHEWNKRLLGPNHPRTQVSGDNLNFLFEKLGRLTRAEAIAV